MFCDREDAGRQLAERLKQRTFRDPLVLAIPRGGVPVGAVLAKELPAELDVVLSRKLRAPTQPELAIGAVSESGEIFLNAYAQESYGIDERYLQQEKQHQMAEIARRQVMFRQVRPRASIAGRSVILTDDGIATGATMIATLQLLRTRSPDELLVAVPVASPERLAEVRNWCDDTVCLLTPDDFYAVGQFYENFRQVDDEEVVALLRDHYAPLQRQRQPTSPLAQPLHGEQ